MLDMLYKIFFVFDVQAKWFMEKLIWGKNVYKRANQIYLHLMVVLNQWLPTKEQHYYEKLNPRPNGTLGSYVDIYRLYFSLPSHNIHLSRTSTFLGPQGSHRGCLTVVFASVICSQSFKMVQSILVRVLSVSPASGPRVLPVAKFVAESLLSNSNGQAAIDFLEKLSLTIAVEFPGAHGDLEALPLRELPLLPVNEEIQRNTHSKSIYLTTFHLHVNSQNYVRAKCFL